MKNTFGNHLTLTLFGESHGPFIGCVLDGLSPGMKVEEEKIAEYLSLRRPGGAISTSRQEQDRFQIVSGVKDGVTCGTPLCILIENSDVKSGDYEGLPLRPGHADFTAYLKYHGYQDPRGGGHFSGRLTAALVAAGAILLEALKEKGILIGTHIASIGGVKDQEFQNPKEEIPALFSASFPTLSREKGEEMKEKILSAKAEGDSLGGVLETLVLGFPGGVGEPFFDSLESTLSHALFSIPAVKGVEFGEGFGFARMKGSEGNDPYSLTKEGAVALDSNHNGGILGGISSGSPILLRTVVKPTPTISKEQKSVLFEKKEACTVKAGGRHDPCIVHRARIVQDAVCALALSDGLIGRFGTDFFCPEAKK